MDLGLFLGVVSAVALGVYIGNHPNSIDEVLNRNSDLVAGIILGLIYVSIITISLFGLILFVLYPDSLIGKIGFLTTLGILTSAFGKVFEHFFGNSTEFFNKNRRCIDSFFKILYKWILIFSFSVFLGLSIGIILSRSFVK